jgi:rod shape determining protein RodA
MQYSRRNNNNSNVFFRLDWRTVIVWLLLVWIGIVNIYSSLYTEDTYNIFDLSLRSGRQALWFGIAVVMTIALFLTNVRFIWSGAVVVYVAALLLVVITLLFGKVVNGSKSWLSIAGMSIQSIEFLKVATALMVAKIASEHEFTWRRARCVMQICGVVFLPMALAILQKDTGSALVFLSFIIVFYRIGLKTWIVFMCVMLALLFIISLLLHQYAILIFLSIFTFGVYMFISKKIRNGITWMLILTAISAVIYYGLPFAGYEMSFYNSMLIAHAAFIPLVVMYALWHRLHYLFVVLGLFVASVGVCYSVDYIFDNILKEHQRNRINIMLGLNEDLRGAGYNVHQSKITIGSGGFSGRGFLEGMQTKYNFVPEQSTDFIFCTIGEEWGFIGVLVVMGLFFILLFRIISIAERQRNSFAKIYGYGAASILLFHIVVNLGMTVGLCPVVGIPLPFISYGGSSMWAFSLLLFLLLRMDTARHES